MFKAVQNGWSPPNSISEQEYKVIKENKNDFAPSLVGFVAIGCSYSGKWFGGYARGNDNKGNSRNYCLESKKNLLSQNLDGIIFKNCNYWELDIPEKSILYLDPPYQGTTKYKDKFNHKDFWNWAENMAKNGHSVFVSEYNAPENWECIWSKEVFNSLTKQTSSKTGIEKLFKYKNL